MYQLFQINITHLSCLSKIDMYVSITLISRLTFSHANNLCLQTVLSVYNIYIPNKPNPFIIYSDTFLLFSGEFGDKFCESLYSLFSDPLLPEGFPLQIPKVNDLLDHKNVNKHVHPRRNEQEVKERMFKSMFDIKLQDRTKRHRIITEATEPVTSRKERLSHFLCHSIDTRKSNDTWSFNFKHYRFTTANSNTVGVGFSRIPQWKSFQTERNPHLFLHPCL